MGGYSGDGSAHVADDVLELYALTRISGDQLAAVEEHLLVCPACQDRLDEADAFISAIRGALRTVEGQ